MCRVRVGDSLPVINLPRLGGNDAELENLRGSKATVVLFWSDDPWMSEAALRDLAEIGNSDDVAIVGVAVDMPNSEVQSTVDDTGANFTQLLDADGKAFNQVGLTKMPRVYVLDESGEIAWFDIEYSQSTHRELQQTLQALSGQ